MHVRPLPGEDGTVGGSVFSVDNVTAAVERRQEPERRGRLVESSPDFLTVVSEPGVVEYQSQTPDATWSRLRPPHPRSRRSLRPVGRSVGAGTVTGGEHRTVVQDTLPDSAVGHSTPAGDSRLFPNPWVLCGEKDTHHEFN